MASKRKLDEDGLAGDPPGHGTVKRTVFSKRNIDRYQQEGQDLARKGKYEEALRAFGDALLQKNAHAPDILDSRSAVYCKMGLYDKALSDAKRMIKFDNQDARGYLRAAKALILTRKPEKALEVYEYALKSFDKKHPQREVLENIRSKLSAKMASKYRDPVEILNNDCLLQIFGYIPFRQRIQMTRVSKAWRMYIKGQPLFWSDISFKGSRPPASVETVKACIVHSQKWLKKAEIHHVKKPYSAVELASRCPRLEHIDLNCPIAEENLYKWFERRHTLKTIILSNKISISNENAASLLKLPNLEHFEAHRYVLESRDPVNHSMPLLNMKCLFLGVIPQPGQTFFRPFWVTSPSSDSKADNVSEEISIERVPNLEKFVLVVGGPSTVRGFLFFFSFDYLCHPRLKTIDLSYVTLMGDFVLHENLESLSLSHCPMHPWTGDGRPLMLPNLRSLVLHQLGWIDAIAVQRLLEHNTGVLEKLHIVLCERFSAAGLEYLVTSVPRAFQSLVSLQVYGMGLYELEDATVMQVLEKAPRLKELHVPDTKVTGSLIKRVIQLRDQPGENGSEKAFAGISVLNLKGCWEVSYEALEWGRQNGLTIVRS